MFPRWSFGRKKCQLLHCVKVANPSRLVPLPPIEGVRLAAGGAKRPPQQVQGRSPWRAFGDFPRDGKVTRVPSMAKPCSRGAPASRVECRGGPQPSSHIVGRKGPAPAKKPPGERSTPFTYTPKRTKSCTPTCNCGQQKSGDFLLAFFAAKLQHAD